MNKKIFVLTDCYETHRLYASLTQESISEIADLLLPLKDLYEEEATLTKADIEDIIQRSVIEDQEHCLDFSNYSLREYTLNTLIDNGTTIIDDEDFVPGSSATVYEAAHRIVLGCDLAYVLHPIGYFTRPCPDILSEILPDDGSYLVWRTLTLA